MNETESIFAKVWRDSELAYSGVLAQTLSLSTEYRRLFLDHIAQRVNHPINSELRCAASLSPVSIGTERNLGRLEDDSGRIDIYAEFPGLVIGIENKKTAGLQENQLKRYETYLSQKRGKYFLIFLAPSRYKDQIPPDAVVNCRERFVTLSYKDLSDLTDEYLLVFDLHPFERCYFQEFRKFTGDLEMKPLTNEDLAALSRYQSSVDVFKKIEEIAASLGKTEPSRHYILVRREPVAEFPIYLGFRLTSDWYFGAPLLDDRGEAIVYVKVEPEVARKFCLFFENTCKSLGSGNDMSSRCDYFPEYGCGLAFRRALIDFVGQEPSRITDWINEKADSLEKILKDAQRSV